MNSIHKVALLVIAGFATLLAPASVLAQSNRSLSVMPDSVTIGESFSLSADGCPGPNPVGASYGVEFVLDYLPPPQLPGDPDPGSYGVTLVGTSVGDEMYVATWSLPHDAPTMGGSYRVSAACIGNELGARFVWFNYEPTSLLVQAASPPELLALPTSFQVGSSFLATASACPGPIAIGADYRVEYTVSYLPPPQLPGDPDPGSYEETYVVHGAGGLHELTITVPADAPAIGGAYQLAAECRGNELGGDFLWHRYTSVPLNVTPAASTICGGHEATVRFDLGERPTQGADVIVGSAGVDQINGLGGDDVICARGGADVIHGGPGNDVIYAGRGADIVHGDNGDDRIFGQGGNDTVYGGAGDDRGFGGPGADLIYGNTGDDQLSGQQGHDRISGGDGADDLRGNLGRDTLWGGPGNDTLMGFADSDRLLGGQGNDVLQGNRGDDVLEGNDGDDELFGQAGDDALAGGPGTDTCWGNYGTDTTIECETSVP